MQNDYCKVYVDDDRPRDAVVEAIRSASRGCLEGQATIRTDNYVVDVEDNEEYDQFKRSEPTDGFLYYRYYLDVERLRDRSAYIQSLSSLLRAMRGAGFNLVPACDFEEQLAG